MQVDGLVAQARKVRDSKPEEMARFYLVVRGLYDEMETVNKKISELKRQMAEELIPEAFDQAGISTITLKEGYRVTISAFVRASSRDMAEGIKWMKKNGHADIVRETINAQTLSALARGMLEKNESLPEDLFNVYVGNNTSITKVA
jgi:hypothetical protein